MRTLMPPPRPFMCGIFGSVGLQLSDRAIGNVLRVLDHRGPDGTGVFRDEAAKITLAHTRLAVIDPETGQQPLHSSDRNLVLIANGEIYDFERIRSSLEAKGHRFATKSDSEIILHLYEDYGLDCLEELRGEFAFLLYDKAKRRLIAARDRFGIKPLYFARTGEGFVFASEMKAIFASGLVEPRLNAAGFDPLLDRSASRTPFPFEGIEQVPPASYVFIDLDASEASIGCYWSSKLPAVGAEAVAAPNGDTAEDLAQSVLHQLEQAVRLRLRADVPVGLFLSGGIDSAFVGALMRRNLNSRPHSFSVAFEGSERSEQERAREAAKFIGTRHHELVVTRQMLWDHLEDSLWFSELPFVTLAPIGKFLLSKEAKKYVTVVLTGEGADEVFLGYRTFFKKAIEETRKSDPKRAAVDLEVRRLKLSGLFQGAAQKLSFLIFDKRRRRQIAQARANVALAAPSTQPIVLAVQEARIAAMPFDILCYLGDRMEMSHSLEGRVPFLDHKLYETAKGIPVDLKMRSGVEKAVLRDAAKGILPEEMRVRRKSGFMLTSEGVDLFGIDREPAARLWLYLSKSAFERAQLFSYRTFVAATLLARLPLANRFPLLRRLRRNANKLIMFMMQAHILHEKFVKEPIWKKLQEVDGSLETHAVLEAAS
jgi:asparagine synthase (glutamine-hydrolysing)